MQQSRKTADQWKEELITEGYGELWVKVDEPGFVYKEHSHPVDTVHVILQGGMEVWAGSDQVFELRTGERWSIAKHLPHGSTIGPSGCTYLTGAKI
ncbi:MAG: hypothetical protein Q7S48_03970 [bacterium]|nr:hypothetical protein [bacterium]